MVEPVDNNSEHAQLTDVNTVNKDIQDLKSRWEQAYPLALANFHSGSLKASDHEIFVVRDENVFGSKYRGAKRAIWMDNQGLFSIAATNNGQPVELEADVLLESVDMDKLSADVDREISEGRLTEESSFSGKLPILRGNMGGDMNFNVVRLPVDDGITIQEIEDVLAYSQKQLSPKRSR